MYSNEVFFAFLFYCVFIKKNRTLFSFLYFSLCMQHCVLGLHGTDFNVFLFFLVVSVWCGYATASSCKTFMDDHLLVCMNPQPSTLRVLSLNLNPMPGEFFILACFYATVYTQLFILFQAISKVFISVNCPLDNVYIPSTFYHT